MGGEVKNPEDLWAEALNAYQQESTEHAVILLDELLSLAPAHCDALHLRGVLNNALGDFVSAVADLSKALKLEPFNDQIYANLGYAYIGLGKSDNAITVLQRGAIANPLNPDVCFNLGTAFEMSGNLPAAASSFRKATELAPGDFSSWVSYGRLLYQLGDPLAAAAAYGRAVPFEQNTNQAQRLAAYAMLDGGNSVAAEPLLRRLLPPDISNCGDLGLLSQWTFCALENANWQEIEAGFSRCRSLIKSGARCLEPSSFQFFPEITAKEQLSVARYCASQICEKILAPENNIRHKKNKIIKIGYLSGDFQEHATAYLIAGVLENHSRDLFEIHAFSYGQDDGGTMRQRIRRSVDQFHEVNALAIPQLAAEINKKNIDILIDLKGWTGDTRTPVLSLRPAPVQVNWLGYPGSLGDRRLADYLIGDRIVTPPETQGDYDETLALLPYTYQPNDNTRVIGITPSRASQGLPERGFVFCSFNRVAKINPEVFEAWCAIVKAVPASVLWLLEPAELPKHNLLVAAARFGLSTSRIVFAKKCSQSDHLARLKLADLALDCWPYGSHTTASDALWAGVPIIGFAGNTFQSRVSASVLSAAGLRELIAFNVPQFENMAIELALDFDRNKLLKEKVERQRKASHLFDTAAFTRSLEVLLSEMNRGGANSSRLIEIN